MKLLFASDSFKGSLTSDQTIRLLSEAARQVFGACDTSGVPVADGGEGTVEAVVRAEKGYINKVLVKGPLMRPLRSFYGVLDEHRAVLEMAAASGLPLVAPEERNPLNTTTYGTGELIRDALDKGFDDISIAIGGSATNDGGMGCARALGVKFLDENGDELEGTGADLEKIRSIDVSGLDPRIKNTKITVMCDVTNPLTGPDGATYTFGAQKGATPEIQAQLEAGMINYRDLIKKQFGIDPDTIQGAGAAGGLGTALMVFLNGEMKSGIETVLDLINFDERLEGVDLVVTGEGRTDWQSCFGKVMQGVGERCARKGIPCIGLSGGLGKDAEKIFDCGISSLMTSVDGPMTLDEAFERAEELYLKAAVRMFRFIRTGMEMAKQ
ncbi:MAG: glycerate kinase [Erysipelotrichaceae bacterium]|nr:glycerate kinase [Erysipelotrichaceae bacterium]